MTNELLVAQIQTGDKDKINDLWCQVENYVRSCAAGFHAGDLEEDLIQEGYFGILEAVKRFDGSKGFAFLTFATHYIKNNMRRFLYKSKPGIRLPEHMVTKIRKYNEFVSAFVQRYGREPTDIEIRSGLGVADISSIKAAALNPTSFDKRFNDDGMTLEELYAVSDGDYDNIIDSVFIDQLRRELQAAIGALPDNLSEVVYAYYWHGKTYAEIASEYGLSFEKVRLILQKALVLLRRKNNLKQYYSDLYGMAVKGVGVSSFLGTWTSSTERVALWEVERFQKTDEQIIRCS